MLYVQIIVDQLIWNLAVILIVADMSSHYLEDLINPRLSMRKVFQ